MCRLFFVYITRIAIRSMPTIMIISRPYNHILFCYVAIIISVSCLNSGFILQNMLMVGVFYLMIKPIAPIHTHTQIYYKGGNSLHLHAITSLEHQKALTFSGYGWFVPAEGQSDFIKCWKNLPNKSL